MSAAIQHLDSLARARPEWSAWLCVVRELVAELSSPHWDAPPSLTMAATDLAPLLAGSTLRPDGHALARLLQRLTRVARAQGMHTLVGTLGAAHETAHDKAHERMHQTAHDTARAASADDALAMFLAAVNGNDTALDQQAARVGATPQGWRALARLLTMPYLHACARRWAAGDRPRWSQGYCPVCGDWPALAEVRGIERTRHLRCGRCGAGWPMPVLACTYCANTNHETLGALVVDDRTARYSLDVCRACSGYLKSCNTLQPIPSDELLGADLASVEFDLAAVERGLLRPAGLGVRLGAEIAAADTASPSSGAPTSPSAPASAPAAPTTPPARRWWS